MSDLLYGSSMFYMLFYGKEINCLTGVCACTCVSVCVCYLINLQGSSSRTAPQEDVYNQRVGVLKEREGGVEVENYVEVNLLK